MTLERVTVYCTKGYSLLHTCDWDLKLTSSLISAHQIIGFRHRLSTSLLTNSSDNRHLPINALWIYSQYKVNLNYTITYKLCKMNIAADLKGHPQENIMCWRIYNQSKCRVGQYFVSDIHDFTQILRQCCCNIDCSIAFCIVTLAGRHRQ